MNFRLTPEAKSSLIQIALYTQQRWDIEQRNAYLKQLDDSFHALCQSPTLGKRRPEIHHALRSHAVGKHIVFYLIKNEVTIIVEVLHERMEPCYHLHMEQKHQRVT